MNSRTQSLFAAFFILFLDNFGYAVTFPLFPILLLNEQFGLLAPTQETTRHIYLGLLVAAYPCAQFFGAPLFGEFADRLGRKKALIWTISGTVCGYFLTSFAITSGSYALIILSRLLTGFFAGNLAVCMAIIADLHYVKKARSKNFGYVAACLGISWILAIWVGSIMTSPSLLFGALGLFSFLSLLTLLMFYRESAVPKRSSHIDLLSGIRQIIHVLENKHMRTLLITLFLWFFGVFLSVQWAALISIDQFNEDAPLILKLLVATGLLWTLGGLIIHPWVIRYSSNWKIALWSLFFICLIYFFGGVTGFFLYFAVALALSGFFASLAWCTNLSLISLSARAEDQGKSLGTALSSIALAEGIGPILGGFVISFSLETLFFTSALLVFCSFLVLLTHVMRRKTNLLKV